MNSAGDQPRLGLGGAGGGWGAGKVADGSADAGCASVLLWLL
jgi:hypothetical protein